jgi:hypothetical protein
MHHIGCRLLRIYLPRTPVNRGNCRRELSIGTMFQALGRCLLNPRRKNKEVSKSEATIATALATTFVVDGGPAPSSLEDSQPLYLG